MYRLLPQALHVYAHLHPPSCGVPVSCLLMPPPSCSSQSARLHCLYGARKNVRSTRLRTTCFALLISQAAGVSNRQKHLCRPKTWAWLAQRLQRYAKQALIPIFYRTPKPASGENDHQIYNSNYYNYSITTLSIDLPHCKFIACYASRKILQALIGQSTSS